MRDAIDPEDPRAAPSCSACAGSASCRTAAFSAVRDLAGDRAAARGVRDVVVAQTCDRLAAAGALRRPGEALRASLLRPPRPAAVPVHDPRTRSMSCVRAPSGRQLDLDPSEMRRGRASRRTSRPRLAQPLQAGAGARGQLRRRDQRRGSVDRGPRTGRGLRARERGAARSEALTPCERSTTFSRRAAGRSRRQASRMPLERAAQPPATSGSRSWATRCSGLTVTAAPRSAARSGHLRPGG